LHRWYKYLEEAKAVVDAHLDDPRIEPYIKKIGWVTEVAGIVYISWPFRDKGDIVVIPREFGFASKYLRARDLDDALSGASRLFGVEISQKFETLCRRFERAAMEREFIELGKKLGLKGDSTRRGS